MNLARTPLLLTVLLAACNLESTPTAPSEDSGTADAGLSNRDGGHAGDHDAGAKRDAAQVERDAGAKRDAALPVDAGAHDAAPSDSGTHDAAASDSGTHDAAASDSGTHDAAASDSGTHDATPADPCATHDCGAHATCDGSSGVAVCTCDAGYQDNDDDGVCAEDCGSGTCNGHGQCSAAGGAIGCTCDSGWTGADCATPDCTGNTCSSHGTCATGTGVAACTCTSGWSGADCATPDCTGNTCSSHGSCATGTGVAACTCDSGWTGADCATPDCTGNTCSSHGTCATGTGVAACTCTSGWSGADCATPDCTGNTCSSHGTCATGTGVAACTCTSGWSGTDCATPDCTGNTCSSHGSCATNTGVAACTCTSGWSGADCATPDCTGNTCSSHGTCATGTGVAACTCTSGWSGADCATPDCTGNTCSSHGTCATGTGVAACTCTSGWSGADCATPDCTGNTCSSHGTCATGTGVAACTCTSGWSGADCATPDCTGNTCSSHGTCATNTGVAACTCTSGWSGADCATPDCTGNTCSSHGSCATGTGVAACTCTSGWSGADCATPDCTGNTCSNHGTCATGTGVAACTCTSGWSGADCSTADCAGITCSGHGSCDASSGAALCTCSAGWSGADCATADCTNYCAHGASCSTTTGSAACTCTNGWSGTTCGTPDCSHVTCPSHASCGTSTGTALCSCDPGFAGDACDFTILYGIDVPTNADWVSSPVGYDIDNSNDTGLFDRVAYRLTLDGTYVWVEAAPFTQDRTKLGVPSNFTWNQTLADVRVRTNSPAVTEVEHSANGNLEFWPDCYGQGADGNYDSHDDDSVGTPGCYGSMQMFDNTHTLFALNAWTGGNRLDIGIGDNPNSSTPDWTFASNAADYQQRRLEVYVHRAVDCSYNPCVYGGCNPSTQPIVCECDPGYQGLLCDECATDYDLQNDGSCIASCVSGACSSLQTLRGLSTGIHSLSLKGVGDVDTYVDGDYDGGGWILIGRGREDWNWDDNGRGTPDEVAHDVGTADAFAPKYLSAAIIEKLIERAPGGLDLTDLDVRLRRAADMTGTDYQETSLHFLNNPTWTWDFPNAQQTVDITMSASALGPGVSFRANLYDAVSSDDQRRILTWAFGGHNNEEGFSYGYGISLGDASSTNYLWEYQGEQYAMPYSEVYIRIPPCRAGTCNNHGTCDDSQGVPACTCATGYIDTHCERCDQGYQDNDGDGSCLLACTPSTCTNPGEGCADLVGAPQCLPVSGTSCLDIQQNQPGDGDGSYVIDPDGPGGNDPFGVACDMTTAGGGWTVISKENFESGNAPGWSDARVDTSSDCVGVFTRTLGGYNLFGGGADTARSYDLHGIPHSEAYVSLDYLSIDSWDGEDGIVTVDGATVYQNQFWYYDGSPACGGPWNERSPQPVLSQAAHVDNSLTLEITSTLDQTPDDESFAADNIVVMIR